MSDVVIESPKPSVKLMRLNRPERLNALTQNMVRDIRDNLERLSGEKDCRVVILTGAGRGFCAGLDLVDRTTQEATAERSVSEGLDGQELFASMVQRVRAMKQPVIAAVNGAAAGAGFALSLAADIRIASPSARFHVAAVKIGLSAGECGISYHLPRYIGAARAFEVMLTGRPIDAEEAERFGLVSRVVPEDRLLGTAFEIADAICANSPFAIRQTKRVMWRNLGATDLDNALELENPVQILATRTEDFKEATSAFAAKRPPKFTGR